MPGVPSGRGCDGCRQQKKKCDSAVYPCSRCKRLNISCVGLGQRRFKFVHLDRGSTPADKTVELSATPPGSGLGAKFHLAFSTLVLHRSLSNETTRLAATFSDKINPSVGVQYNLAWTYGDYLNFVPARLGTNEALDTATDTFISALRRYSGSGTSTHPAVLEKYGLALSSLRRCLNDPVKAKTPETLCAILFLWNSQSFIRLPGQVTAHAEGVAQLIKLRGCAEKSKDPFESRLLLALRAVVLFDSLWHGEVEFSDQEWIEMFDNNPLDELSPEGQAVQCMTRLPNLMRRSKAVLQQSSYHQAAILALQNEVDGLRDDLETPLSKLRLRWHDTSVEKDGIDPQSSLPLSLVHCHLLRTYSLGLTIAIFINECRLALCTDRPDVVHESHDFAQVILGLSKTAIPYRPFGAYVMLLCLSGAALGAGNAETMAAIRKMLADYASDFHDNTYISRCERQELICGRRTSWRSRDLRYSVP